MQGRQIPTAFRQFPTNRTVNALLLAVKVAKGQ